MDLKTLTDPNWFHDEEFHETLPLDLSLEVARFYGTGEAGIDFAQGLASFMASPKSLNALREAVK